MQEINYGKIYNQAYKIGNIGLVRLALSDGQELVVYDVENVSN